MARNRFNANLPSIMLKKIENNAEVLGTSKSGLIEAYIMKNILMKNNEFTEDDLNLIIDDFIPNNQSKFTSEFKEYHKNLSSEAKKYFLLFWYELLLINGISVSSIKQANIYKGYSTNKRFLFYYGIYRMHKEDIDEYINKSNLSVYTLGNKTDSSNSYLYIGRRQQFNQSTNVSEVFDNICEGLDIPRNLTLDVIKIHYRELERLAKIIKIL